MVMCAFRHMRRRVGDFDQARHCYFGETLEIRLAAEELMLRTYAELSRIIHGGSRHTSRVRWVGRYQNSKPYEGLAVGGGRPIIIAQLQ